MKFESSRDVRLDYELNLVPNKYAEYLTDWRFLASRKINIFYGREKEVNRIFTSLRKTYRNNIVLLGDHGVGKSATVKYATSCILDGHCPEELKECHIIS